MTPEVFANLYSIPITDILQVIYFDPAKAVKVTICRPIPSEYALRRMCTVHSSMHH